MDRINHPIHQQRHMKIICIGAGLAGLCFAYKLQRSFTDFSLTIYEKNAGIGGVWFENRYPGVRCDFPSHNYCYSFEPNASFTSEYAEGKEIRKYFVNFAAKYDLNKYIKFRKEVIRAEWNEEAGSWLIRVKDLKSGIVSDDVCDILINAGGVLNNWRWPDIEGLKLFKGDLVHSGNWDESLDLRGKSVGVIGNGSSGQQLVENLQPIASHLTHFIRQPSWITGPFGAPPHDYTTEELDEFSNNPGQLLKKRKELETKINTYFGYYLKDSEGQKGMRAFLQEYMKQKLEGTGLDEFLIPNYAVGCRRPTPGVGYLDALKADNTTTVLGEIARIEADGVVDGMGKKHVLDALVCATGFDVSYKPRFPLLGEKALNLQDVWSDPECANAYLATAIPGFPNYFMFFGPGNPWAGGSYIWTVECQADYILKFCDRWQTENIHSFSPKQEVVDEFVAYSREAMQKTVWTDDCRSWFKKGTANPNALILWPGSSLHFMEALSDVREDDWNMKYRGNRWAWLGNGFSQTEMDENADKAFYLGDRDTSPFLSRQKRRQTMLSKSSNQ